MKKLFISAIAILLLLAGCSLESPLENNSKDKSDKKKSEIVIGVSISTLNNPFFVKIKDGIEDEAKKQGVKVKFADAQDDAAKQSNDIDDLIQQNVDYLIVNPTDSDAISGSIQIANDQNIPVITLDREVAKGEVASFIASDNVKGGEMGGQLIVEQFGKNTKVAELEGIPGASATRERGKGFHNVADKSLDVVSKQSAKFNRTEGLNVTQNIIQAHPDIKAIFAQNDEMALGAVEAVGNKDIKVIGFDGNEDAIKSVENNKLYATVAQQPHLMGEESIKTVMNLFDGKKVEQKNKIPLEMKRQN
ncbi:D-ribose ABC transporter substrate-binding protein [Staphylococcus pseudoxylosus]|uniref:D-ribose ABC transporter substrate-binding protein n=1 Tax=Staphylococcus pseudoxylosus TaxID=2282419 RepID=A0AAQ0MHG8_9STAP|nr:D-ribose ABC transporter substrate-binding protein [Staphylococcus pseudoxylosus]PTI81176.1 D-ribose ABC transporter substrate-binding protein [Staphylococcus xylosus]MBM2658987.1 D-ribose ABC transporter substrate-binding protein [Staphylococcus pseudoxylosus]MCE5003391.1 D-ribose ABC transporter substrate-binding protein [Staphylococcus pseudoxylosus]MDW8546671.1 D-ribose ABC transporter substrate-binding protein [Staphylococcus pseudoxylosus]MEB5783028.1 D-ribose ABC transporter substrat